MVFDLAQVITAIGGVIGAIGGIYALWTKYNQDAKKNKKTEYEIEKLKVIEDKKRNKKNEVIMQCLVFGGALGCYA